MSRLRSPWRDDLDNFASERDFLLASQQKHKTDALLRRQSMDIQVERTKES